MKLEEMEALATRVDPVFGAVKWVYLILPRRHLPKGEQVRLTPTSGPLGRICVVNEMPDGSYEIAAVFPADGILRFVQRVREMDK